MLITISKDFIIPTENWNEQKWLEEVKPYGILDIIFWEGVSIEIDPTKLTQQGVLEGNIILKILNVGDNEYLQFSYTADGKEFNLYHHNKTKCQCRRIADIEIQDSFESLLL